jgi:hypothetical protein
VLGTRDLTQIHSASGEEPGNRKTHRMAYFSPDYATLLRSVGTEFKVMQELMRHSSLRSTLDIYAQAITPAKHAAQAAVVSLMLPPGSSSAAVSTPRNIRPNSVDRREVAGRRTHGAQKCALFAPLCVSLEYA